MTQMISALADSVKKQCKCCSIIQHGAKTFTSVSTNETFNIKYPLTRQSSFVVYLLQCKCGYQYVGRTMQKLQSRMNQHRSNIKKGFLLHSVLRHCSERHANEQFPLTPIDHILELYQIGLML